jgi:hypothetical protein
MAVAEKEVKKSGWFNILTSEKPSAELKKGENLLLKAMGERLPAKLATMEEAYLKFDEAVESAKTKMEKSNNPAKVANYAELAENATRRQLSTFEKIKEELGLLLKNHDQKELAEYLRLSSRKGRDSEVYDSWLMMTKFDLKQSDAKLAEVAGYTIPNRIFRIDEISRYIIPSRTGFLEIEKAEKEEKFRKMKLK